MLYNVADSTVLGIDYRLQVFLQLLRYNSDRQVEARKWIFRALDNVFSGSVVLCTGIVFSGWQSIDGWGSLATCVTNYAGLAVSHGSNIEIQGYSLTLCSPSSHAWPYLDLTHDSLAVEARDMRVESRKLVADQVGSLDHSQQSHTSLRSNENFSSLFEAGRKAFDKIRVNVR